MASGMVCVFFLSVISGLCLICFLSGEWSTPAVTGHPPPPLSYFSFTLVGSRAVLFAGLCDGVARNDVYCLDIDRKVSESVSDAWWELCGVGLWRRLITALLPNSPCMYSSVWLDQRCHMPGYMYMYVHVST